MGRGSTLKKQLKNQKAVEAANKSKTKPKAIPKPVLADPEPESEEIESEEEELSDEYHSEALSKKEQRKLRKLEALIDDEAEEDDEDDEDELDLEKLAASDSESDINGEDDEDDEDEDDEDEEDEDEEEEDEEEEEAEDVPLSDAEIDSDADVVPHTKLTINNVAALKESLARIQLPWAKHLFVEHQSVVSAENTEAEIKDIYDDTQRELAFYKQGLDAVKQARSTLLKLKVPFSRPMDYFAEMVKSDEHMDKLKNKLLTEAANKKASEEAKKQRNLKKFGKEVQNATLQERAKQKRETLDKIKSLKKKKRGGMDNDDEFQIALEEATRDDKHDNKRRKPNGKRLAKDAKYGSGGMKRFKRTNDSKSSADVSDFSNHRKSGGGSKSSRPGKSKRRRN